MYKLMIVDDEPMVVEGMRDGINWKQYGIEVAACAYNGAEALERCREVLPDIIITDIKMPGLDGLDFISAALSYVPHARFIIISAFEEFSYAQKAISLNVQAYLVKPVRISLLVSTVQQAVQSIKTDKNHPGFLLEETASNEISGYDMAEKAKLYIDQHIHQEISLNDVAKHVNLSPSYFSRTFKKESGMAFVDYVRHVKMEKAKILLATTNQKVYEIAQNLGYLSIRYFIAIFKSQQGETPQEYRTNYLKRRKQQDTMPDETL